MALFEGIKKMVKNVYSEKALVEILKQKDKINNKEKIKSPRELTYKDFTLFHIEELTFEDGAPRKEALENVIGALDIDGVNFIYLLLGDKTKVSFYLGMSKIKNSIKNLELDIDDIGTMILQSNIEGNFRGSKTTELKKKERLDVLETISEFQHMSKIDGVPNVNNEKEEFQGVDRLVDVMMGDQFALLVIADPLTKDEIENIENTLFDIHNKLTPFAKQSIQKTTGESVTVGKTKGENNSLAQSANDGITDTHTSGFSLGTSASEGYSPSSGGANNSKSFNDGLNEGISAGRTIGSSVSKTKGDSISYNESKADNTGENVSQEFTNKLYSEWIEYLDEVLFPRLEYGKSKSLFNSSIYILANEKGNLLKLGNTIKSLFSGVENNKAPLNITYVENKTELECVRNLQSPILQVPYSDNKGQYRLLHSRPVNNTGTWLSVNELSVIASLPQKEVVGLTLKEEVEFGLNTKQNGTKDEEKLLLGSLVKSGNILDIDISIDKKDLNKHIFIAGVTGSGKTTTCQRILSSAKYPFMVIEPAKTEYRVLTKTQDDILIFTLGNDSIAPFRINPFEFFKGENISARVDMIKANIEAAFDMEAAIPQLIEAALYECYEAYGWDISTSKNSRYEDPFADGVYSFPTLSDLIKQVEKVVNKQGFDDRLKNDYLGSIRARLQGLTIGSKGFMLNTPRSVDFSLLIEQNVILELEEIKSGAEKSLVMGFVLINLNEALKQKHKKDREFRHITLIEEAHRLLAKYTPGENPSKKLGVETFADMLAEVRKYGESLIIVDQIPNKLTPEVLKNTNTKIVHKLFAADDKDAIGNTMALNDEQKEFLSSLETGRVIVSNQDFVKPIQVQIKMLEDVSTTQEDEVEPSVIREICLKYYQKSYKKGVIQGLELNKTEPSLDEIEKYLCINFKNLIDEWSKLFQGGNIEGDFKTDIKECLIKNKLDKKLDLVSLYLMGKFYNAKGEDASRIKEYLDGFLDEVMARRSKYSKLDNRYLKI